MPSSPPATPRLDLDRAGFPALDGRRLDLPTLYAAPLAALGEGPRAAALLARAHAESCGMLAMVLRDPANASLVGEGGVAAALLPKVFARMPSDRA